MADVDAWMPLWIGDYLADTQDLTTEEHGAYFLLLMTAWRNRGRLPAAPERLARIAKLSGREWSETWKALERFFDRDGDELVQQRLGRELATAISKRNAASEHGKKGARARHGTPPSGARVLPEHSPGSAQAGPGDRPSESPSPSEEESVSAAGARSLEHRAVTLNTPVTADGLTRAFGEVRSKCISGTLPWVIPRIGWQQADAAVSAVGASPAVVADVLPTMFRFFELAREGKIDDGRAAKDPTYGFACWAARFTALREEIHGVAPQAVARASPRSAGTGYVKVTGTTDYSEGMELFGGAKSS